LRPKETYQSGPTEAVADDSFRLSFPVKHGQINNDYKLCAQSEILYMLKENVKHVDEFIHNDYDAIASLKLNKDLFIKSIGSADIIQKHSTRTSCFTKK
jgi:hypothetical protein